MDNKPKVKVKKVQVRTGKKLRHDDLASDYDVIIVGSGIGGLTNAALLSLLGKKVCVLEQHYTAGGFTHAYWRNGYEWDVGVHYIGEVHKEYSVLRRVFDVISDGRLKWQEMDPVYDRIILGNESFDFVAGRKKFIANLAKQFPNENKAIEQYVALIRKISASTPKFFAGQALPPWMARLYLKIRPLFVPKECFQTTRTVLEQLTKDQKLISVLTGQWGDYGQVPEKSAFLMHALLAKHYLAGAAYPVGGASSIAREIIPTIQNNGGNVFTHAEVDKLIVEGNRAKGVRLVDGTEIFAQEIVSNIGFMNTVKRLLPEESRIKHQTDLWVKEVDYSRATICLYAGFKGDSESLKLNSTNLWLYPNGDHEGNVARFEQDQSSELPLVYISFPSTKDPQWSDRFPDKSTVEIVSITDMAWFESWRGSTWNERGEDYLAKKEALSQQLLEKLYQQQPQLKDKLDFYELSTPLSTEFYQLNQQGEIYGLEHFVERFEKPFLHPQTPIKNFYMTGSDILTAGVGGALMGGVMTTLRMLGLRNAGKVKALFKSYKPQIK